MALERRNEYLEALGIDVWIPRQRHARAVPTASTPNAGIVVGPGTGNVLLLCASSAEAAMPHEAGGAAALAAHPETHTVAIALGIVMHRHSLNRHDALQRLQQQAAQAGTTLEAVSERLITAQEVLAGLGSI